VLYVETVPDLGILDNKIIAAVLLAVLGLVFDYLVKFTLRQKFLNLRTDDLY
jgi:transposase